MDVFQHYTPDVSWEDLLGRPVGSIRNQVSFSSPMGREHSQVPGNVAGMSLPQNQSLMLPKTAVPRLLFPWKGSKCNVGQAGFQIWGELYLRGQGICLSSGFCFWKGLCLLGKMAAVVSEV